MLRKVILGSSVLTMVPTLPTVKAATPVNDSKVPEKPPPMRPSDLPIYETPHADYVEFIEEQNNVKKASYLRTSLVEPVSTVRQQVQTVWEQVDAVKTTAADHFNVFQDRTAWIVKYLREEENKEQRYGAVAMGGLTGFIFGLRGGFFRRVIYATVGTGIMGSLCFPEETSTITADVTKHSRHYINVAYNFFYGVKPGDPQLEVKFPELSFPKDFSEFVDLSVSMASSIKQAVMPPPSKDGDKPTEKSN